MMNIYRKMVKILFISRGRGRGQSAPETSDREIFAYLPGKERQGKKKMEPQNKENLTKKGRCKLENERRKAKLQNEGFCFSLFKTTEICSYGNQSECDNHSTLFFS